MGGALSHNKLALTTRTGRRRQTTTSATEYHPLTTTDVTQRDVTYHDVTQHDVKDRDVRVRSVKKTSRLLSVLIGRKSATVATFPADNDVISGSGAQCWHQQSTDSGYNEDVSGVTNHSTAKFDLEHNLKVTRRCDDRRPKRQDPVGNVGPSRHKSVYSFFSRASSVVRPMMMSAVSSRRQTRTDDKVVDTKVKVNDSQNVKVVKQSDHSKSTAGSAPSPVPFRCDNGLDEVRCSRLLECLDEFIRRRCHVTQTHIGTQTQWVTVSSCLQSVDRDLMTSGWQDNSQITETTVIFVYSLLSQLIDSDGQNWSSSSQLRTLVYVCLYMTYSYIGPEISYPLRPFIRGCHCTLDRPPVTRQRHYDDDDDDESDDDDDIIINHQTCRSRNHSVSRPSSSSSSSAASSDDSCPSDTCRQLFWTYCMTLMTHCSSLMLRLNSDSNLYTQIYGQLTTYHTPHIRLLSREL